MKIRIVAVLLMSLVSELVSAQVFRCNVDGRMVYSDQPCGSKPDVVRIAPASSAPPAVVIQSDLLRQADERAAREAVRRKEALEEGERRRQAQKLRDEMEEASREKSVTLGMDEQLVKGAWGEPDRINKSIDGRGAWEQWIYERGRHKKQYVHFLNGKVVSAQ